MIIFFLKENDRKIVNKLKELTKNEDCFSKYLTIILLILILLKKKNLF